jgi:tRNA(adenine34) deaminase
VEIDSGDDDRHWMCYALELAGRAAAADEVPVGAVIVRESELLGEGWNRPISSNDPTAYDLYNLLSRPVD